MPQHALVSLYRALPVRLIAGRFKAEQTSFSAVSHLPTALCQIN